MGHFDAALSSHALVALSAILLQVSYSFFNKVGPNAWYLVGVGIRIAIGIGLHTAPTQAVLAMPFSEQEYRKRLFYCLYMMDRLVSISLGRPFGIQDEDIEVELFTDANGAAAQAGPSRLQLHLHSSPLSVPLHIVRLRRIAGRIFTRVYSGRNKHLNAAQRDDILQTLHSELIDWRRSMPFPLPVSHALPVPQFSTAWYDLNYYQHVLMLYRPSPLCPILTIEKVSVIAEAASMYVSQVSALQLEKRYAFNWLNLFSVFTVSLTLIYSTIAQPGPLSEYLRGTKALDDLRTISGILAIYGRKFPSALKCMALVQDVVTKLELRADSGGVVTVASHHHSGSTISTNDATNEPDSAYPTLTTGNTAYDNLQEQVRQSPGQHSQSLEVEAVSDGMLETGPQLDFLNDNFDFSATDLGNAAAQVMANGMMASASMDMDEEMMQLLDGVWAD
ncbi:hypothetical protein B0A48_13047 [Cryoendolithus antarcticus]|uniref:Xylanolytic transcriptional activator regulatory domain-containing protein n=1 Tax=Cryoendolithus antarcticus TaxID=1507870 RepID=A0A1V8SN06_9PEZI|nr:hypothetical protein B0A48_13047 [Cryoendolithus antarcticus]